MNYPIIFPMAAIVALSACMQTPVAVETSREDNGALYFFNETLDGAPVRDQMKALTDSADALVKASRLNGALIGAAVGCGVTALTGSNARQCLVGATVGGIGGAVIGTKTGERSVERRVELVSEADVAHSLNATAQQFAQVRADLPAHLATQEAELNRLTVQLINGDISQDEHDLGVLRIEQDRMDLADALSLSARELRRASANLQDAARRGQSGLDWHIGTANRLADDVESTRSSFSTL